MTPLRTRPALCALLLPAAIMAGCGGGVPGGAVATVDGESIEMGSFNHWLTVVAKSGGQQQGQLAKPPDYVACVKQKRAAQRKAGNGRAKGTDSQLKAECGREYNALRDQALQLLVSSQWIEGEADDLGISVKDAEIKKTYDKQRKAAFPKDEDFQNFLESSGQTEEDILLRVRTDTLSNKIREKVTKGKDKVTDAEIKAFYAKNKERFAQPERRDLRVVLTKGKARAEQARGALEDGDSFAEVAKRYSIDQASKAQGGRMPAVAEGQQAKAFDDAIFGAKKGALVGPVKTQFGFYVFEVTKVRKSAQQTLAQAKPVIEQRLAAQGQQKRLDAFLTDFRARWRAKTECREGYVTPDCKNGPKATPAAKAAKPRQSAATG